MKFLQVILSLSILLLVPLLVVESSSSLNNTSVGNITRGSSLSTSSNDTSRPYWLSPSGNIAFGFYQLPCRPSSSNCTDRFVVGIWLFKSSKKTLVWTANRGDTPLHKPCSILFTNEGKLVLRIVAENEDKPLIPDIQEPVSYAKMHDNGNFVLYGSESQIVWQSFNYPTDTILGGQKLKDGFELASSLSLFNRGSGTYKLSIRQSDGRVAIYRISTRRHVKLITDTVVSRGIGGLTNSPVTLNLDTTGELYIADSDDVILRYLYRNKNHPRKQLQDNEDEGHYMYRATLESRGDFVLYKERIDGNSSSDVVRQLWRSHKINWLMLISIAVVFSCGIYMIYLIIVRAICS